MAGVIGLVCVVAIVVITVCRIHMRREAIRQMLWRSRVDSTSRRTRHPAGNRVTSSSVPWQQSLPCYHDTSCEPYRQLRPPNVAINLNLQLGGVSEINNLMVTPPPYTEVEETPENDLPPPPYSTLDRRACVHNQTATNDNGLDGEQTPIVRPVLHQHTESANTNNNSPQIGELRETERLLPIHSGQTGATPQTQPKLTDDEHRRTLLLSDTEANFTAAIEEDAV